MFTEYLLITCYTTISLMVYHYNYRCYRYYAVLLL